MGCPMSHVKESNQSTSPWELHGATNSDPHISGLGNLWFSTGFTQSRLQNPSRGFVEELGKPPNCKPVFN